MKTSQFAQTQQDKSNDLFKSRRNREAYSARIVVNLSFQFGCSQVPRELSAEFQKKLSEKLTQTARVKSPRVLL